MIGQCNFNILCNTVYCSSCMGCCCNLLLPGYGTQYCWIYWDNIKSSQGWWGLDKLGPSSIRLFWYDARWWYVYRTKFGRCEKGCLPLWICDGGGENDRNYFQCKYESNDAESIPCSILDHEEECISGKGWEALLKRRSTSMQLAACVICGTRANRLNLDLSSACLSRLGQLGW